GLIRVGPGPGPQHDGRSNENAGETLHTTSCGNAGEGGISASITSAPAAPSTAIETSAPAPGAIDCVASMATTTATRAGCRSAGSNRRPPKTSPAASTAPSPSV